MWMGSLLLEPGEENPVDAGRKYRNFSDLVAPVWLCLPAQKGQQDMQSPQWLPAAETLGWCSCREQNLSLRFGAPRLAL